MDCQKTKKKTKKKKNCYTNTFNLQHSAAFSIFIIMLQFIKLLTACLTAAAPQPYTCCNFNWKTGDNDNDNAFNGHWTLCQPQQYLGNFCCYCYNNNKFQLALIKLWKTLHSLSIFISFIIPAWVTLNHVAISNETTLKWNPW